MGGPADDPSSPLGVFCLEGPWSSSLTDASSVGPLLDLLERRGHIRFAHKGRRDHPGVRDVHDAVVPEARRLPLRAPRLHGEPGAIFIGRKRYRLEELAIFFAAGGRSGSLFGSCATLDVDKDVVEALRKTTKA